MLHSGLAAAVAGRYRNAGAIRGLEPGDLYQTALLGFLQSLPRFDEKRGATSTHLWMWGRGAVCRELEKNKPLNSWPTDSDGLPVDVPASVDDTVNNNDVAAQVEQLLAGLPPRERRVLIERYGLCGEVSRSSKAVGERLGVSARRVQQLEERALARLRSRHSGAASRFGV